MAATLAPPRPPLPTGWPTGFGPGDPVAVQTPQGLLSGRVESAALEVGLLTAPPTDWLWPPGAFARDTFGAATPPAAWPTTRRHRLDLTVRLDGQLSPDPPGTPGWGNEVSRRVRDEAVQVAAERMRQTQIERAERDMALMMAPTGAAAGTGTGLFTAGAGGVWGTAAADATDNTWGTYTNTAATWSNVTTQDLLDTMNQYRATAAASATTTANVWYSTRTGTLANVDCDRYTWNLSDTGTWGTPYVQIQANWCDGSFSLASGDWGTKKPEDRLREMIRDRMAPMVVGRARNRAENPIRPGLERTDDFRELRARETLAKVVGAEKFRRFVRDGFVTARAKSGRTYQIFPGHWFTRVYKDGAEEPRLCVVLNGNFPPTDSLIVRYLLILNDETRFRSLAVNQGLDVRAPERRRDDRPLADVFADLKGGRTNPNRPRFKAVAG